MHNKNWIFRLSFIVAYCVIWIGPVGCQVPIPLTETSLYQPFSAVESVSFQPMHARLVNRSFRPVVQQDPVQDEKVIPDTGRPVNNRLLVVLAFVAVVGVALVVLGVFTKG